MAKKTNSTTTKTITKQKAKSVGNIDKDIKIVEKKLSDITVDEESGKINPELMYMMNFRMHYETKTVGALFNMFTEGELNFNVDIQRGEVWTKKQASLFIHSLFFDMSTILSSVIINTITDDKGQIIEREAIDGKQRILTALIRYMNGEFPLCGLQNEPYINYKGKPCQINGLHFKQLPNGLQKVLESVGINCAMMDNATHKQKAFIFLRINNSKPMNKFDLAKANKEDISDILNISKHEIFNVMCGKKLKTLDYYRIIVKSWIVINEDKPIITGRHIDVLMKTLNMSEAQQNAILASYDIILDAYKILLTRDQNTIAKTILMTTHFLSYLPFVGKFSTSVACADWFVSFYSNIPNEYSKITEGQTDSTSKLQIRMNCIERSINTFLETYTPSEETDEQKELQMSL